MNVTDFRKGLEFVLQYEGGYVDDPDDKGGETKWGISKRAYPEVDIKNLTREEALRIYQRDYWIAAGCDSLSYPMNVVVFDSAVNCGVARAKAWLRASETPEEVIQLRKEFYVDLVRKNPAQRKFLRGWAWRIIDLQKLVIISKQV